MLSKARKKWLDTGSSSDEGGNVPKSSTSLKHRFPLLQKASGKASSSTSQDPTLALQMQLLKSKDKDPLQTLVALELLRAAREKPHTRQARSPSSSSSDSKDAESEHKSRTARGLGKAFADYRQSRRRMFRNPKKHIKKYVREVQGQLGAGPDTPFRLTDYSKKIWFGKQRTLQRLHVLLSEVLTMQLENRHEEATLQVVLGLRAIHQASLDSGNWEIAWLLTHLQDPMQRRRFGGEESQLETVAAYLKSQQELEKRARQARFGNRAETENPDDQAEKVTGPGEGQRAQSSQGCWQRPEQLKRAFCPELIRFDSVRAVRAPSALSVLQASAGPFGRFWREYKSCRNRVASASLLGTRAFSSSSCEECMLFPSLLPIWESCSLRDDEARSKLRSGSRLSGPCSVSWSVGPLLLRMPYNR
eukprot:s43_g1.t1